MTDWEPSLLARIVIESLATLLSKPLCVHHALKQDARAVLRVTRARVERLLDRKARVQADATLTRSRIVREVRQMHGDGVTGGA